MTLLQALLLGLIQGITELLPISSSGHLIILPELLGWEKHNLVFDTTLHLGTAFALIVYFWKDLKHILFSFLKDLFSHKHKIKKFSDSSKLGIKIIIATIPAGFIGLFFGDILELYFRSTNSVAIFLLCGSILMLIAEKLSKNSKLDVSSLSYFKSFFVGLFQSLALLSGFSRSGASISGGMLLGLDRSNAAKFSFLLSIPIVLIAGVFQLKDSILLFSVSDIYTSLLGLTSSFLSGFIAIAFLMKYLKSNNLYIFIIYRLFLALLLFTFNV